MSRRKARRASGFTLLEVLVAVTVLAVGLLAVAALMSQMGASTNQSRYMGIESLLASEKLEDLNQFPANAVETGPGGNLAPGTYNDKIQISSGAAAEAQGDLVEIKIGVDAAGAPNYTIVSHSPNGTTLSQTNPGAPPAATVDMLTFNRQWTIVQGSPVGGVGNVRTITVTVSLANAGYGQNATFTTSMVRP